MYVCTYVCMYVYIYIYIYICYGSAELDNNNQPGRPMKRLQNPSVKLTIVKTPVRNRESSTKKQEKKKKKKKFQEYKHQDRKRRR